MDEHITLRTFQSVLYSSLGLPGLRPPPVALDTPMLAKRQIASLFRLNIAGGRCP